MTNANQKKFSVGLDSWIIRDGNYDDFEAGKEYAFALEFYSKGVLKSEKNAKVCSHYFGGMNRIQGQVVFVCPECWVIDCGILAYTKAENKDGFKAGDQVEMEAYLGIDPYYYFEELHEVKDMPAMIYRWRVAEILLNTTPWVTKKNKKGDSTRVRNMGESSFRPIDRTNAWDDDDGDAAYILDVERLPDAPVHRR